MKVPAGFELVAITPESIWTLEQAAKMEALVVQAFHLSYCKECGTHARPEISTAHGVSRSYCKCGARECFQSSAQPYVMHFGPTKK